MKPIEKYQQKFIELLKEAEEELGGRLTVRVSSAEKGIDPDGLTAFQKKIEYKCAISTANYRKIFE